MLVKSPAHLVRTAWQYAPWAAGELLRNGRPQHLVYFYGKTPGDDLMCTAVLRELRKRGARGVWMMSRFPELFAHNSDVDRVVTHDARYPRLAEWIGAESLFAHYGGHDHVHDRSPIPTRHIIALMCQACGIIGEVALRPYLHVTASELHAARATLGATGPYMVVHSSGQSAHSAMRNKEWTDGRMQQAVDALRAGIDIVQLGAASDPPLAGCIDLRGRTTIRESAAIIANATLLLGQVGFLMHLARAVDTPAVIVYGGREAPWQSGYPCNTNLTTELACSPCWRWNACDNPIERECMQRIAVDTVVDAVRALATRVGDERAAAGDCHARATLATLTDILPTA